MCIRDRLTAAKSYDECIQLLTEKGWGDDSTKDAEASLAAERRKTWGLISELVEDMSVFDVFLYANDYHNLKAAIKEVRMGHELSLIHILYHINEGMAGNSGKFRRCL